MMSHFLRRCRIRHIDLTSIKVSRFFGNCRVVNKMQSQYKSSKIASSYVKYRPTYNKKLSETVINYLSHPNVITHQTKFDLMVDVGCGSGQSANLFQPYFKRIIGTDVSLEQLKQAESQNKYDNIQYLNGNAENILAEDNSVDLIVVGLAAHWFDLPKFFAESKRVLKLNGCLAIFGYYVPELSLIGVDDDTYAQHAGTELMESIHINTAALNPETYPGDLHVKNRYADIFEAIPFIDKERDDTIHKVDFMSVNDLSRMFRSLHYYEPVIQKMIQKLKAANIEVTQEHIDSFDVALQFKSELIKLWNLEDADLDQKIIKADYSLYLLLARNS